MRRILSTLLLSAVGFLAGCSSPKIITNVDPDADFSAYRTYNFADKLGTETEEYEQLTTQFLKDAVARQLEARGYTSAETPDLLVNFYLYSQEKIRTSTAPTGYYGYRRYGGYGTWGGYGGYETTVSQYTEGTLNVDLVDSRRMQLVWEGAIVGQITDKMRSQLEQTIDKAVEQLFEEYPFTAPVD